MKKLTLSLILTLAIGTTVMAESYPAYGSNSYKAKHDSGYTSSDIITPQNAIVSDVGFYLGLAYGPMNANSEANMNHPIIIQAESDYDLNTIMLQAGYKLNQYIAIEGRYWRTFGDIDYTNTSSTHPWMNSSGSSDNDDENVWGIYIKPSYPINEDFNIYILVGYASIDFDDVEEDEDGLSWGIGASFSIINNLSVFIDYVRLYDDDTTEEVFGYDIDFDVSVDSWNFGISYNF
ncbi:outer membrane protein [Sulfurovum riftiae]|uniref:Outer membrane protein beta-barrel domain-containing protein n=1 Tax=Sulfurovum riftiae TaxID=1630136 RepID=A0A151CFP9_9BACT|nr:outer membrane beta-barrel protein [Sulfurovum riftiae]KYJ86093.1 hypothetical protein AS592_01640 [Sulfurovum riftiae]